jgi:CubicO group peptidase (beta-lactamase class C family)
MASGLLQGHIDSRFEPLRDVIEGNLASGAECGLSVTVDVGGRTVVDVHGGFADEAQSRPWAPDTIVNVWSTTKTVTSLAVLMLADRGLVDVDAPVAAYWPEFAANGKEQVLVRHVMSHSSGVAGWEAPFALTDMYDRERSTALLAAQAPWWEPGTTSGYHALNYGHLLGEVVRRVSGKTLTEFVATAGLDPDSVLVKTLSGPPPDASAANTEGWRLAEIGAANGHGNARSVARVMSAVTLGGTVDGVRLLSQETIGHIFREQTHGTDLFLGVPIRFGIGYALPEPASIPFLPEGRVCFWGGWGGSVIIMDLDRGVTVSYMMNKMQPGLVGSDNAAAYVSTVYKLLG